MSDGTGSDHDKTPGDDRPNAGTSLAPATEGPSGIDPFLAKASEAPAAEPARPFYAKALDYSAHAAMIVGLIGFAWTVSDHVVSRQPASPAPKPAKLAQITPAAATPAAKPVEKPDEVGELRKANQKMASEIRNLHASLEALRTTVVRERSSGEDVHALNATIDGLKANLASVKSEQATALAQLNGKLEKLQREERQPVAERGPSRAERQQIDTTTTASIPAVPLPAAKPTSTASAKAVPTPPSKPTVLASTETDGREGGGMSKSDMAKPEMSKGDDDKPPVIQGWVVRDVYEGVALLEGRRGQMEVVPGVSIPGAGVVKSIERHGAGWTVTTTKGQVAYAAPPQREYRRGPGSMREFYGPRGYDY